MRVLHMMASGARGGGADHLLGLLPALQAQGCQCVAAVGGQGPLLEGLRARQVESVPLSVMGSRVNASSVAAIFAVIRRIKADVVHFHGTRAAFFGALAVTALWPQPPVRVYTAHGLAYRKPKWGSLFAVAEWLACQADGVISVCQADLADLGSRGFLRGTVRAHICNAVDSQHFVPSSRRQARRYLNLDPTAFIVGTTARLVPQKSVIDLLDALAFLPDALAVVIGDGPQMTQLQNHPVARSGRVRWLGDRSDVSRCLPALNVFALTSRWEGEPVALLEAMACGLPCIATDTYGAREVLGRESPPAGVLVPVGDAGALAAAMHDLAGHGAVRRRLGRLARQRIVHRSFPKQAQQILGLYHHLLRRASTH